MRFGLIPQPGKGRALPLKLPPRRPRIYPPAQTRCNPPNALSPQRYALAALRLSRRSTATTSAAVKMSAP